MPEAQKSASSRTITGLLAAVGIAAIALRLAGIDYGLPLVFNGDEPHHVNVAVSFGRGSLNPGIFKYPTLWMYTLFGSYGLYFLIWGGFGFLHSVREFGTLFAWDPGGFYLVARLLSAALSVAALHRIYRCGSLLGGRTGLWAGAWLAASPTLVMSAHSAKPDSLMFFLAAWAWWFALSYRESERPAELVLCGVAVGLCVSTQYIAAPLLLLVPAAWATAKKRASWRLLACAAAAVPAAFFAGSPFVVLDWRSFLRDIADVRAMAGVGVPNPARVLQNVLGFSDPWFIGGGALAAGAVLLARSRRSLAIALLAPSAFHVAFLASSPNGTWARFMIPIYPALALTGGLFADEFLRTARASSIIRIAALALILLPGSRASWAFDADLLLPDTRNASSAWIREHLPAGAPILTFNEHTSPDTPPSRAHLEMLLQRARETGHPRRRYYEMMAARHPGGGFAVYRIAQDPKTLQAGSRHVAWSAQGRAMIDVRPGLAPARAAGIQFVIYSSYGSNAEGFAALARFTGELEQQGTLIKEFKPRPGIERGPDIRIYRIAGAGKESQL